MNKVLIILGPTATGKTDLAIKLAKKYNGELIACDSRQVYKNLDIGTGKLPGSLKKVEKDDGFWIIDNVKIWMYDLTLPEQQFNVKDYVEKAKKITERLFSEGKLPIIVGGTGLYLKVLLGEFLISESAENSNLREKLEKLNLRDLQQMLYKKNPKVFEGLNNSEKNNKRRLIRKLELVDVKAPNLVQVEEAKRDWDVLKIGLKMEKEKLNQWIDERLNKRIEQGLLEESSQLFINGMSLKRMRELGLEYGVLADLLEKKITKEEFIVLLQNKIHQYAKRQMTWFKKETAVNWFDISNRNFFPKVDNLISHWYNCSNAT